MKNVTLFLTIFLAGCFPEEGGETPDGGGGGGGSSKVQCQALDYQDDGLNQRQFWPSDYVNPYYYTHPPYGANVFYIWELEVAGTDGDKEYYYKSDGLPVKDWLPAKGWKKPETFWSAVRFSMDNYDLYKFDPSDPFYLWYIPYTPGGPSVSWRTKAKTINDGSCTNPDERSPRCMGRSIIDPRAPRLTQGKAYMFMMGVVVPPFDVLRVQTCYQAIIE